MIRWLTTKRPARRKSLSILAMRAMESRLSSDIPYVENACASNTGFGFGLASTVNVRWGSRRYQQKIFGKGDSDEITAGRQKRLHLEKQYVLLYVTSYAERDVTVLDSKTSSVTPG